MSMQVSLVSCVFQVKLKTDSYRASLDAYMLIMYFTINACFVFTVL